SIQLTGHGFGHGHGMSQYGAEGAARQGKSYRQILDFYYPGTKLRSVGGKIDVLITADRTSGVVVLDRDGLKVRDLGDGQTFSLAGVAGADQWRIKPVNRNRAVSKLQFKRNGSWHRYRLPGRVNFKGDAEFYGGGIKTLVLPGGER